MPTDAYWALAAFSGWTFGFIMAAYALGQARQLNTARAEATYDAETIRFLKSQISPFDRDGDGRPGGSLSR